MTTLPLALAVSVLFLAVGGCGPGPADGGGGEATPRPTLVPAAGSDLPSGLRLPLERADAGAALQSFARDCSPCHGLEGRGDGPRASLLRPGPADFLDEALQSERALTWQHRSIAEGKGAMPPWGLQYDERRIWDLAFLTWSLALAPRAGDREAYGLHCASCHGGEPGEGPQRLDLAARAARSFSAELALLRQGPHPDLAGLDDATRAAALRWSWTQLYEPLATPTAAP